MAVPPYIPAESADSAGKFLVAHYNMEKAQAIGTMAYSHFCSAHHPHPINYFIYDTD